MPEVKKRAKLTFKSTYKTGLGRLAAVLSVLIIFFPGNAKAAEKITKVNAKFESVELLEDDQPLVEGETSSNKYFVEQVMTLEEYEDYWEDDDDDDDDDDREDNSSLLAWNQTYISMKDWSEVVYVVELDAADGYLFSLNKEKIKLSGLGATYVKHERLDSKTRLILYVTFADLDDMPGEAKTVSWTEEGRGDWEFTGNPSWYELRLYADGKLKGDKKVTGASTYDFRPLMQLAGTYHYTVCPISAEEDEGEWAKSEVFTVTEEMAEGYKSRFQIQKEKEQRENGPSAFSSYVNLGWQQEEDGRYWYRELDGSYPQKNWRFEEGFWYFFDENGYMVKEVYVDWGNKTYYIEETGHMITSGKAPDGRIASADGTLKWPDN